LNIQVVEPLRSVFRHHQRRPALGGDHPQVIGKEAVERAVSRTDSGSKGLSNSLGCKSQRRVIDGCRVALDKVLNFVRHAITDLEC